jgi:hypothetical protein
MSFRRQIYLLRTGRWRCRAIAVLLAFAIMFGLNPAPTSLRGDWFSHNTTKFLSDNSITIKDNLFYTPVTLSGNANVMLQLSGGPWGSIASGVFGIIVHQLENDQANKRFDEISQELQEMKKQLNKIDAKLDRIDLALREISDKNDQILDAIHSARAQQYYDQVLRDVNHIQDHWDTCTKTTRKRLTPTDQKDLEDACTQLGNDAGLLIVYNDPTYTPALAVALRLELDLARKLGRKQTDLTKKYRRFLDAALATGRAIKPGDPVQVESTDSFPVRLAKRKALIAAYLKDGYQPQAIKSASGYCLEPYYEKHNPTVVYSGSTPAKDSFFWDPPTDDTVLLRLIHANVRDAVSGPDDGRFVEIQYTTGPSGDDLIEAARYGIGFQMRGAWDS